MKVRLMQDSVRLRLNQTDVGEFAQRGELAEKIEFPGKAILRYSLRVSDDSTAGVARFENGELTVTVPAAQAKNWAGNDREVGLYYKQDSEGGTALRLIIEKDFQCVDGPPEETDPAGYPNPLAGGKHRK